MIKFLVDQGISPDRLISSPAVRAYTTANYFRKGLQLDKESLVKESDLYFGGESDWLDIINSMSDDINCPAFFSHNPTITYFSNQFSDDPFENIPTCGVVHLQSTADKWSALHFDNTKVINHFFPKEIK